jgi:hypothetical protein
MSYDYKAHFGEVTLTQDLMVRADDRRWRLTPPRRGASTTTSSSISAAMF